MAFTSKSGVKLHFEVTGSGAPLLLQHGWTNSVQYWHEFGYVESLSSDYQLILIDARGHGRSTNATDLEAYDTQTMAEDVLTVMDDLGVEKAHFFGYSMGGWIGFDLATLAPERLKSMVIGGAHPYQEDLSPLRVLVRDGTADVAAAWDSLGAPLSSKTKQALLHHDPIPLRACLSRDREDISDSFSTVTIPCLALVGEDDVRYEGMRRWSDSNENVRLVSFPGNDHLQAWMSSDLVLPIVKAFLASI